MRRTLALTLLAFLLAPFSVQATILGSLRGIVHDPQHRPLPGASILVSSENSDWKTTVTTDQNGEFLAPSVPLGDYKVTVNAPGFSGNEQSVHVASGSAPILHFELRVAAVEQQVQVTATPELVNPQSSTTENTISQQQIAATPGATRSNSLAMITDFVPGAYLVHDQLHVRGGHQVQWLIDGVPVPNTNIASNVGPQFDPKDIDELEVQRGGYSAEYGDRTYGEFNVVTRSGFERNHQGELVMNYGSYNQTNDQLSFGSHTDKFAYYASVNGNRSDLGLETPVPGIIHDQQDGLGAFTSLIYNATPSDQLRFVGSGRGDYYQIPNTPDDQVSGIRDHERERDAFANFSWLHTSPSGIVLTVSPFFHHNLAAFEGGPNDPLVAVDDRVSNYAGGQASIQIVKGAHNARAGFYGFAQNDDHLFGLLANDGTGLALQQRVKPSGDLEALFLEDQYRVNSWLTLNGGVRLTRFSGELEETATNPRAGAAVRVPRLNWVLRGFYGRFYQPPPLNTVSGPLLSLALQQGAGFLPLRGERDEEYELGLAIPWRGWTIDSDIFRTHARNFFDHDVLENSNIFFPLTIARARIQGFETTVRSPRIAGRFQLHSAYSHQSAEGAGAVTGGLTDFAPPEAGFFVLDHDQRHTISAGALLELPWRSWGDFTANHGSGFLNGDGPFHLPSHTTFDLALGKSFGESWSVQISALNLTDNRYLIDLSNTFGGTHVFEPRQVIGEVRYRFHY